MSVPIIAAYSNSTLARLFSDGAAKADALVKAQSDMETFIAGMRTLSEASATNSPPTASLNAMVGDYLTGTGDPPVPPIAELTQQLFFQVTQAVDSIRQTWDATGTVGSEAATPKAIRLLLSMFARAAQG
jgi:hypothetical protein